MKTYIPQIVFEITDDCNLKCSFCYNIWKSDLHAIPKTENSYKKAKKTLKRLFKISNVKQIVFAGGEPMLSEGFFELVNYCSKKKNKIVSVVSNGNVGNKADYKKLSNAGVKLFEFPFFSENPEIHDNLTQIKGSWIKTLNSIKTVLALGEKVVPLIVITKQNCAGIDKTVKFLYNLGITEILINRFNIGGAGINNVSSLLPTLTEFKNALLKVNFLAKKHQLNVISSVCIPQCLINPNDYEKIQFSYCPANVLNRPLTLDIDGNLRICNHSPIKMGNIFKDNLETILTSDYVNSWTETIPKFCSNCELFERCFAGCRAASEQIGNDLSKEDPIIEMITYDEIITDYPNCSLDKKK